MPTAISGDNVWVDSFDVPDDGEDRDAASVQVGDAANANRSRYLYERVINGNGWTSAVAGSFSLSTPVQHTRTLTGAPRFNAASFEWIISESGGQPAQDAVWALDDTQAKKWVLVPMRLPNGVSLDRVRAKVEGRNAVSSAGAFPTTGNRMQVQVFRKPIASGTALAGIGSAAEDPDGTALVTYEGVHIIEKTIVGHTVDTVGYSYYLGFRTDENGKGAYHQGEVRYTGDDITVGGD